VASFVSLDFDKHAYINLTKVFALPDVFPSHLNCNDCHFLAFFWSKIEFKTLKEAPNDVAEEGLHVILVSLYVSSLFHPSVSEQSDILLRRSS
jgi:hypothetical protein